MCMSCMMFIIKTGIRNNQNYCHYTCSLNECVREREMHMVHDNYQFLPVKSLSHVNIYNFGNGSFIKTQTNKILK